MRILLSANHSGWSRRARSTRETTSSFAAPDSSTAGTDLRPDAESPPPRRRLGCALEIVETAAKYAAGLDYQPWSLRCLFHPLVLTWPLLRVGVLAPAREHGLRGDY